MENIKFNITEREAAERLGMSAQQVRQFRKTLVEGTDYTMSGRALVLSDEGLKKIALEIGGGTAPRLLPPAAGLHELILFRSGSHGLTNKHIVFAYRQGQDPLRMLTDEFLRVNVRDNTNYWRGQKITAREIANGLFEHWDPVLQRQATPPRMKGKV